MSGLPEGWPHMSIADAHAKLTAPGAPFEMIDIEVRGQTFRFYKNAPPNMRLIFELGAFHADHEYIVYGDERMTYTMHQRATRRLAKVLVEQFGVQKGDRVVVAMRNYPEWVVAFWAIAAIGAVATPLNAWWTGEELEYGFLDSGAKIGIVDGERAERLRPHLQAINLNSLIVCRGSDIPLGAHAFEDLVGEVSAYGDIPHEDLPPADIEPDDNLTIFYTSGTTGKPKGALGTHRNIIANLMNSGIAPGRAALRRGEEIPVTDPNDPKRGALLTIPLFHATGCHSILVPTFAAGYKLVFMHKWDPVEAMSLIEREKLASFGGVPAIVWQVLEHPDFDKYDLSTVDSIGYGGAPAAAELPQRIKEAFPNVAPGNGYGMTETSAITTTLTAEEYIAHPESCGIATPVTDLKTCDPEGNELPKGSVGELWIRGPQVVKGYWNKPEATQETFRDGWVVTGDIARVDEEGYCSILDRAKDMLIRGGENIYCVEVENTLYDHPRVMDAAVIGIPHHSLGEEVGAIVQVTPGIDVSEPELQAHVAEHLARFKVPVRIDIRSEPLPRNPNGKILKRQLRDEVLEQWGKQSA